MTAELISDLLAYIDGSPSPFHATDSARRALLAAGYEQLDESQKWDLAPGGRYLVTRNDASLAAFHLGTRLPVETGFDLIGAHTDSPNLRLKPTPEIDAHGYRQLGVEVYGGVLLSTWLDRDLGLAGRVFVDGPNGPEAALVHLNRPLLRVPNLAIHLNRTVNVDGLKLNPQRHLVPVLGLARADFPTLAGLISEALVDRGVADPGCLRGFDLGLCDVQPSAVGGVDDAFVFAPRLDNLSSCFSAIQALLRVRGERARTRGIVLYDHEEVGSRSGQGADSTFLADVLRRVACALGGDAHDALPRAVSRSMLISADMAHAVHPNYADKHDAHHRPRLGAGPVIKTNVSQAYATDGRSSARFRSLCARADVEPQAFVSRADLACGSTIGPITASHLGLPTVDVGNPLLSMHSIREMAATADVGAFQLVLDAFFE